MPARRRALKGCGLQAQSHLVTIYPDHAVRCFHHLAVANGRIQGPAAKCEVIFARALSTQVNNYGNAFGWGSRGEVKARGGRRCRCTSSTTSNKDITRNPHAPEGFRRHGAICFVAAPRRYAPISPASRRLASGPVALGTRPFVLLPRAASPTCRAQSSQNGQA